ncbi:ABC transporter ATP-binding protein [Microbacterium sp. zg.Y625]|uniref:ATP-binding cassette domain-containing protein n=1 Tax=Microbacterium jiangjiandongii TaxID=3049071 RepID=UPI00214C7010|nr:MULTISPECIES: ABC transporter ATP-binding protein [unclassified Microbacterium]MCR2791589.1 ABC transporter ATP-binding protein [Microbacterium sp. zg.Y625]WIM24414.1 ABC transporter ATP-binding protein [Microbacterium sp. zg-Y625]
MTPLLAIENLGVRLDGPEPVDLVHAVDVALAPGERLGIIGESGSGKSLTALAVLGLLGHPLAARGSVRVDTGGDVVEVVGTPSRRLDRVRGTTMGAVFQEPLASLDPLMRVGKQLSWPLAHHRGLRGDALRRAVLDALADVQLSEPERIARSYIHEISGGQRQRVAIALALAAGPRLLIADEPTTALDVTVQAGILELLQREVTDRGMTLLFISHDLPVVSTIADRVLVMREGRQVELGTTTQILGAPGDPYTAQLVAASRRLDDFLPRGAGGSA